MRILYFPVIVLFVLSALGKSLRSTRVHFARLVRCSRDVILYFYECKMPYGHMTTPDGRVEGSGEVDCFPPVQSGHLRTICSTCRWGIERQRKQS